MSRRPTAEWHHRRTSPVRRCRRCTGRRAHTKIKPGHTCVCAAGQFDASRPTVPGKPPGTGLLVSASEHFSTLVKGCSRIRKMPKSNSKLILVAHITDILEFDGRPRLAADSHGIRNLHRPQSRVPVRNRNVVVAIYQPEKIRHFLFE